MNVPTVSTIHGYGRTVFVVVNSGKPDNFDGCYWHSFDENGNCLSYGRSKGWSGDGAGSALSAMKLGRGSAQRWLKKWAGRRS